MPSRPYDHAQWRKVRQVILERDEFRCRIRGPSCEGDATEVDHIIPWQDGGAWFDPGNLRASCKPCNRSRAAKQKHEEGWRRSDTHIVLVVGPPGAGKTTHVAEHAGARDLVVDYDLIAQALGSKRTHGHEHDDIVQAARNAALSRIRRGETDAGRAWIVSANPEAERMFPHHEVVVVDPGRDETVRRGREAGRPDKWVGLVDDWYRRRDGAQRVGPSRDW